MLIAQNMIARNSPVVSAHGALTNNQVTSTSPTSNKAGEQPPVAGMTLSAIKGKYNLQNITPKEIDALVNDLRGSKLADPKDWLMLATNGYEFRSHLSFAGGTSSNERFDLLQQTQDRLAYAQRRGQPTASLKDQLAFIQTLTSNTANTTNGKAAASGDSGATNGGHSEFKLQAVMQQIIDHKTGIDREKIDEIDKKIKAIQNDDSISDEQKASLTAALEQEKAALIKKSAEQMSKKEQLGNQNTTQHHEQANKLFEALTLDRQHSASARSIKRPLT